MYVVCMYVKESQIVRDRAKDGERERESLSLRLHLKTKEVEARKEYEGRVIVKNWSCKQANNNRTDALL